MNSRLLEKCFSGDVKDSVDAQKQAQAKIEAELELREQEKAERDSLIAEKMLL